jgi:cytochrome c oxidase assembly protein subunit 15
MWTVTYRLMPLVVTLHLLGGMSTLALLVWLLARQRIATRGTRVANTDRGRLRRWAGVALAVLFCQIALGGWVSTNYAGMACADDLLCHGAFAPELNFAEGFSLKREPGVTAQGTPLSQEALNAVQWTHRMGAVVTVTLLGVVAGLTIRVPRLRKHGVVLLGLAVMQVSVGIANVLYVLPLQLAVAHNALAASLLMVLVTLTFEAASPYRPQM